MATQYVAGTNNQRAYENDRDELAAKITQLERLLAEAVRRIAVLEQKVGNQ